LGTLGIKGNQTKKAKVELLCKILSFKDRHALSTDVVKFPMQINRIEVLCNDWRPHILFPALVVAI
jgi:hypothetical protein